MHTKIIVAAALALMLALPASAEETTQRKPVERPKPVLIFPEAGPRPERLGDEYKKVLETKTGENVLDRAMYLREQAQERKAEFASSTDERREALKERIMERRAEFASSTVLKRAALSEHIKEQVTKRAENAVRLLDAMLTRLAGLADRIQARIDTLSGEGVDTSEAEAQLAEAEDLIEDAAVDVDAVTTALETALSSEEPRAALGEVKTAAEAAKTALRAAHQGLMEAVQALPGLQKPEATTN